MKRKGKLKPNQEREPDLDLNYSEKDIELITGYLEVFEEQVIQHIDRNVNEMTLFLLKSQILMKIK